MSENEKNNVLDEHRNFVRTRRAKKPVFWAYTSLVLVVVIIGLLYFNVGSGCPATGNALTGAVTGTVGQAGGTVDAMDQEAVKEKALAFINEALLQGMTTAQVLSVEEKSGLYVLNLDIDGREIESYVSLDGSLLFPQGVDLNQDIEELMPPEDAQAPAGNAIVEVNIDGEPTIGSDDAPITMVIFDDFECPFCARFEQETWPSIKEKYVDTGLVKYVFRNFPLGFHANAQKAAEASECIYKLDEEAYWAYKTILFDNQDALDVESLKQYAAEVGTDSTAFNECLDNDEMKDEVENDMNEGASYGVQGTPAFFINGMIIEGALPFSEFEKALDSVLAAPDEPVAEQVAEGEPEVVIEESPEGELEVVLGEGSEESE